MRLKRQRLGQHFLRDPNIVKKIVSLAHIGPGETVVEIGPGQGILTRALSRVASDVLAIELDPGLHARLKQEFNTETEFENIRLVHADVLRYPPQQFPASFKVVANLPYAVSTPLLFRLLDMRKQIRRMVLMFQLEVAQRIVARAGGKDYGPLSIGSQFYSDPRLEFIVPSGCFSPKPCVDSAVVSFQIRKTPRAIVQDESFFFRVVRGGFAHRRKLLRNALKDAGFRPEAVDAAVAATLLSDTAGRPSGKGLARRSAAQERAERLTIEDWARLADKLFEFSSKR